MNPFSSIHYCIDQFVPDKEAHVSVHDLGFSRAYSVFDVLRTYNRKPFHLHDHIQRFLFACSQMHLPLPYDFKALCQLVYQLIEYNSYDYALIKLIASAGVSHDGFNKTGIPLLYILCYPLNDPSLPTSPVNVHTFELPRLFPHIKTTYYLPALWMLEQLRPHGFDDLIYIDPEGYLLEGTRSNLFFIQGKYLITPEEKVLKGITKEVLIRIGTPFFTIIRRPVHFSELSSFDEAFLCASVREVIPIHCFNDHIFTNKEHSYFLQQKLHEYVAHGIWPSLEIEWSEEKSFSLNH